MPVVNARGQRIADADMSDIPMDAVMHTTPAALRPKVEPVNSVPCGYFGRNVICSVTHDDASNESAITQHVVFSDVIGSSSSPQTENRIIIMSATVIDLEMSESEILSHLLQWICDSASTATIIWSANKAYSAHPVMLRNRKEVQRVLEERSCGVDLWEAMSMVMNILLLLIQERSYTHATTIQLQRYSSQAALKTVSYMSRSLLHG